MEECYSLVKLQAEACNFTESNSPPWVFFTCFVEMVPQLRKWSHIFKFVIWIIKNISGFQMKYN